MKYIFISIATIFSINASAISTCESTVVPLALQMAKASGQKNFTQRLFVDVDADYSEIVVTLTDYSRVKEAHFRMTMGEEFKRSRKCIVTKVEAI